MTFSKEIIIDQGKDLITVILEGELDIYSSGKISEELASIIEKHDADLLCDMTQLDYLDSSGLGALIAVLKQLKEKNRTFYIKGANSRIRNLFKITRMEEMFEFVGKE